MPAVQFFGLDSVMDAAENLQCPNWGIFIGRSMFSKCEAADMATSLDMLDKYLEVLKNSDSNTVYTLKFFEKDPNKQIKITEKTVCDGGSFNFKLVDPIERDQRMIGNATNYHGRQMEEKIAALEKKLAATEKEEEPETLGDVIRGLIQKPHELAQLVNIGRAALGLQVQPLEATVGSTHQALLQADTATESDQDKEIRLNRLGAAIDTLERSDPRLVEHLEKLAKMAEQNPDQFTGLLGML